MCPVPFMKKRGIKYRKKYQKININDNIFPYFLQNVYFHIFYEGY